jgi:hypothetical protein
MTWASQMGTEGMRCWSYTMQASPAFSVRLNLPKLLELQCKRWTRSPRWISSMIAGTLVSIWK